MSTKSQKNSSIPRFASWIGAALGVFCLSLALAWVSSGFVSLQGWIIFFGTAILSLAVGSACWWAVQKIEGSVLPRALAGLILLAALLRLGAGVLWYVTLPSLGHDSAAEQAGYVMADAQQRDQAAWELAQSEKPLWKAFRNQRSVDQYGGMLFTSALLYRYLGGADHLPLQMVLITASISALAVLFTWVLARRIWNLKVAWIAAWFLLLFPEAILLGSSQMREAFTITLVVMAFYGLVSYFQDHTLADLAWVLVAILLFLPFSPLFTALLVVMLALTALFYNIPGLRRSLSSRKLFSQRRLWLITVGVLLLVIIAVWFALGQFAPEKISNPIAMINWWIKKSADWQAHLTERASGKIQAIFERTPEWSHAYLLLAYGIAQPLLPAALVVTSQAPIWQGIAIWRALGWTILLILLLYASVRAWTKDSTTLTRILIVLIWLTILVASFRGGGDQWDNPRYRTTFAGLLVAVAAWGWTAQRRSRDRVFRYALIWVISTMLWFVPWYLQREFHIPWPVGDAFKTLGLGTATAALLILWDWARWKDEPE